MDKLATATDIKIEWNSLIQQTSPNLSGTSTIGQLIGGVGYYPGITFFFYFISGLAFVLYLIYGGILLMTSGGDPKKVEGGKTVLTHAFIGLFVVLFAFLIMQLLALILGLDSIRSIFTSTPNNTYIQTTGN